MVSDTHGITQEANAVVERRKTHSAETKALYAWQMPGAR